MEAPLLVVLGFGVVLTGALVALASAAYVRRPRRSTLLVVLALGTLFANSVLGVSTLAGVLPRALHHLGEHSLVAAQAALVLAAVYHARTVEHRFDGEGIGGRDG